MWLAAYQNRIALSGGSAGFCPRLGLGVQSPVFPARAKLLQVLKWEQRDSNLVLPSQ